MGLLGWFRRRRKRKRKPTEIEERVEEKPKHAKRKKESG
jgi:hypothetical protein